MKKITDQLLIITLLIFIVSLCSSEESISADYYVSPNGNDGSSGSIDAPFKTFLPALKLARPGDTIYARGGTYGLANTMIDGYEGSLPSRTFISLASYAGASGAPAFNVANGTAENPITIRNYGDEIPLLDTRTYLREPLAGHECVGSLVTRECQAIAISVIERSYWIIQGFQIIGGMIYIGGLGPNPEELSHDITIKENDLSAVEGYYWSNIGLIKIDRADYNGPFNIFIENNVLRDNGDVCAIMVMSACSYSGIDAGCTGYIKITGNHVYNTGHAFFFKNAMTGPVDIFGNVVHDIDAAVYAHSSNIHFAGNLVYNVPRAFEYVGVDSGVALTDPATGVANGRNIHVEYNTFANVDLMMSIVSGINHTVNNNIIAGLRGRLTENVYDLPAYIEKSNSYSDPSNPANSILQTMDSNHNCLVTTYPDFIFVKRNGIDAYSYSEGVATFGFDTDSVILYKDDPTSIFIDPANRNYNLIDETICPNMGFQSAPEDLKFDGSVDSIIYSDNDSSNLDNGTLGNNGEGIVGVGGCNLTKKGNNINGTTLLLVILIASLSVRRSRKKLN